MHPPDRAAPRRSTVALAYGTVCLLWGSTYLAIRLAVGSFAPFQLSACRYCLAGGVLYLFSRARGERSPTWLEWRSAAITGTCFFVISNGSVNTAERTVSSGLVSVLLATMPLWMTVLSHLFGTTASAREMVAVATGLAGVVVLNLGGDLRATGAGAFFALASPIGWSLGSLASRRLPASPGTMFPASQMVAGGLAALLVSLALREPWGAPSLPSTLAMLYLAMFGSLLGFTAYTYLLANTRPAFATSYAYVNPVVAVALGVTFAGERFGLASAAGTLLILGAVALVRAPARPRPSPPSTPRTTAASTP